jgi:hypothetical protein
MRVRREKRGMREGEGLGPFLLWLIGPVEPSGLRPTYSVKSAQSEIKKWGILLNSIISRKY